MPPDDQKPRDLAHEIDELRASYFRDMGRIARMERVRDLRYEKAMRRARSIEAKVDTVLELLKFVKWAWRIFKRVSVGALAIYELITHRRDISETVSNVLGIEK